MNEGMIRLGDLEIDLKGHCVRRAGETLELTHLQFQLLAALAEHPGQTFTRQQLISRLHGHAYEGFDRSIDAHIKNLRQRLEHDPAKPEYIQTVYGVGYKCNDRIKS
jgi:DNA-binding response OmpR family regulator